MLTGESVLAIKSAMLSSDIQYGIENKDKKHTIYAGTKVEQARKEG